MNLYRGRIDWKDAGIALAIGIAVHSLAPISGSRHDISGYPVKVAYQAEDFQPACPDNLQAGYIRLALK